MTLTLVRPSEVQQEALEMLARRRYGGRIARARINWLASHGYLAVSDRPAPTQPRKVINGRKAPVRDPRDLRRTIVLMPAAIALVGGTNEPIEITPDGVMYRIVAPIKMGARVVQVLEG